jgi:putative phosphoserine phosphatase/1-acylglycerol-3-phosphate O-acyltransferase
MPKAARFCRVSLMTTDLIRNVEAMEDGPHVGAFFDFDGTIVSGFSALIFIREQLRRRQMKPAHFVDLLSATANLALGLTGFSEAMAVSAGILRGVDEKTYTEFGEEVYRNQISRLVFPEARALIRAHLRKGHTVAIVSSATPYQIMPAARDLHVEHILCTRLKVAGGKFSGEVSGPTCWGPGKVTAVQKLASTAGIDLARSAYYGDSRDDLDLLEHVGHPCALNPDSKLEKIATDRGWPVSRFKSKERGRALDYLRSVGVYGSLVGSTLIGVGVWGLSGSKNEGRNAAVSLWADVACALVGLKLKVVGEEKLWANRPAVVIANHQSKADGIVVMKLLRGNFAAVGKKEIRDIPLVSQAIQFAGVIPIDRKNATNAIEAMKPLIQAMHSEGRFAVVAPEGTRSTSTIPGPFKKGAFHIAMQAGVPIVPLVIHNAIDVQPKGDFLFRPATVLVEILDPVDTSAWKAEDLDTHVAVVRNLYLRALGHPEDPVPPLKSAAKRTQSTAARRKKSSAARRKQPAAKTARKKKSGVVTTKR